MITITSSSSLITSTDVSHDPAIISYATQLYTRAVDTLLTVPNELHHVVTGILQEMLPITGIRVASMTLGGEEVEEDRGGSPEVMIDEWNFLDPTEDMRGGGSKEDGAQVSSTRERISFERFIKRSEENLLASVTKVFTSDRHLAVHWLIPDSKEMAVCLFHVNKPLKQPKGFSDNDRALLGGLAHYLFRVFRLGFEYKAQLSGYGFLRNRLTKLAEQFGLTKTETRLFYKLVTGADNAAIAKEMGISIATVKTHITHILQKTNCRNRNALLGRYFSSIESVGL